MVDLSDYDVPVRKIFYDGVAGNFRKCDCHYGDVPFPRTQDMIKLYAITPSELEMIIERAKKGEEVKSPNLRQLSFNFK
ncbi:MAG: hypothetical protein ABIG93_02325 [archaeon]|nr:hypothetical protein [Nanoarchaeota archaeon]